MIKFCKIHNECEVEVFEGSEVSWALKNGYTEMDVIKDFGGRWVLESLAQTSEYKAEQLAEAKALKFEENIQKRNERLNAGVLYKGVMFDSDTDSKVNIMGAVATLPDEAVVGWNSMDNETAILTKSELNELGGLLVALTSAVWGEDGLNVQFINAINSAQTIEEVEAIEINYYIEGEA